MIEETRKEISYTNWPEVSSPFIFHDLNTVTSFLLWEPGGGCRQAVRGVAKAARGQTRGLLRAVLPYGGSNQDCRAKGDEEMGVDDRFISFPLEILPFLCECQAS